MKNPAWLSYSELPREPLVAFPLTIVCCRDVVRNVRREPDTLQPSDECDHLAMLGVPRFHRVLDETSTEVVGGRHRQHRERIPKNLILAHRITNGPIVRQT